MTKTELQKLKDAIEDRYKDPWGQWEIVEDPNNRRYVARGKIPGDFDPELTPIREETLKELRSKDFKEQRDRIYDFLVEQFSEETLFLILELIDWGFDAIGYDLQEEIVRKEAKRYRDRKMRTEQKAERAKPWESIKFKRGEASSLWPLLEEEGESLIGPGRTPGLMTKGFITELHKLLAPILDGGAKRPEENFQRQDHDSSFKTIRNIFWAFYHVKKEKDAIRKAVKSC